MPNHYELKGKTVLLTGGNGQIGRALVARLLREGAFVYVADIQEKMGAELADLIRRTKSKKYRYEQVDITSGASVKALRKRIKGTIDVLINNAGIGCFTPFEQRTEEELDRVLAVNLKGTILCAQVFSEDMIRRKQGKIINVGSIYGIVNPDKRIYGDSGRNSSEIYGATKAGVIHATKYLANYLGEYNVLVNAVSPGGVFNNQKEFFVKNYVYKTPLGRMAGVEDLEGVVCFLCSDESNYITGQNIAVDGGFSIR